MADSGRMARGRRERAEPEADAATELDELRPLIDLAREIKREVDRIAADDSADIDELSAAIDRFPQEERRRVALAVFDRLPVDVQWAVLERVFGDDDLRDLLADEHDRRLAAIGRSDARIAVAARARDAGALDTRELHEGDQLTLGLFRESEVRAATARGHRSTSCARSLVLRGMGGDQLRVVDDLFNPLGGFYVARDYDEATWARDRFASHDRIRVGAASDGPDGTSFEPVAYLGGRVDFEDREGVTRGRLHLGFVMLGDIDVFAGQG